MATTLADLIRNPDPNWSKETLDAIKARAEQLNGTLRVFDNNQMFANGQNVSDLHPNVGYRQPMMPDGMPENYIQRSGGAPIPIQSYRPAGPALDYSSAPVEFGGMKGYRVKGDPMTVIMGDGRIVRMGADTGADRKRMAEDLQLQMTRQKLSEGNVDEQLKRAQLAELMGMDPAQMGGMGAVPIVPIPTQTPGFFPENTAQPSGAQRQVAELSQKILERRYGKPEPGQRWDNQGKSIPIPGYEKPLGETPKKQVTGVQNLSAAIDEYQKELGKWSALDIVSPDKRAAMGVKYNNMMLQAKEAYNLGVLNGPDYEILTSVVTNPASMTGAITSNKAMSNQAEELKRMMQKVGENASISDPRIRPGQSAPQAPPPAAVAKLKSDPSLAAAFDAKYGAGSAAKALGR